MPNCVNAEVLQFRVEIEGHPDNVAPTIYGGLNPRYCENDVSKKKHALHISTYQTWMWLTIPTYELKTEASTYTTKINT